MTQDKLDLAKHRLERANEQLKSAEILFESKMYRDSLSRSYYAMFSAARAILATKNFDSKKHSRIISLFNQHFVKQSIIDRSLGQYLNKAKMKRESSDYTDFYIVSRNEALEQISTAKIFVSSIEDYINQLISGNQNNQEN